MSDIARTGRAVWDSHAQADPLWAVLSFPDKTRRRWGLQQFMETGEREAALLFQQIEILGLTLPEGPVLDFGCGVGRLTQALARRRHEVIGVDISPEMIAIAERLNQYPDRARYVVGADPAAAGARGFALVYSNMVLQHVDPRQAVHYVRAFIRLLRSGGLAIFQVPSHRAVASNAEIRPMADDAYVASLRLARPLPPSVPAGSELDVWLQVGNASSHEWSQPAYGPMAVGNHWLRESGRMLLQDDARAPLLQRVPPRMEWPVMITMRVPEAAGRYVGEIDLVHEGVTWFEQKGSSTVRFTIDVTPAGSSTAASPRALMTEYPVPAYSQEALPPAPAHGEDPIPFAMNAVPHQEVVDLIRASGGELAHLEEDRRAGPEWVSYRYFAVRCPA